MPIVNHPCHAPYPLSLSLCSAYLPSPAENVLPAAGHKKGSTFPHKHTTNTHKGSLPGTDVIPKRRRRKRRERGGRRAQNAGQISPRSGSRTRKAQNKLRSNWLVIDLRPRDPKKRSISLLEYYSACEQCLRTHSHKHTLTHTLGQL